MSQPPAQSGYLFDRREGDQERLIQSSEALAGFVTEACQRAGLGPGGRAIDVGCGPLGALPALSRQVGSAGHVVGLDASAEALGLARTLLDQRACWNVTLVRSDVGSATPAHLCPPGPFDLAYMRRFLVHQPDPAETLRHVARLTRSGGRIVAHEIPPFTGFPRLIPAVPALRRVDDLVHAGVEARGARYDAAEHFAALCAASGLRLVSQRGFLPATEPVALLGMFQAVLRSLAPGVIGHGLATREEVEALLGELERAKAGDYVSAFANLYIEMIAEVP